MKNRWNSGKLAAHIAEMFGWTPATLQQAELDFSKMDYKPFAAENYRRSTRILR
jgi:hypothetical protein